MSELFPAQKVKTIEERLRGKRSIQTIRTIVSEVLNAKPSDLRDFSFNIGSHHWRGVVYQRHNSLMGSVFSLFDNKVFCLRGYPKIKYSDDSGVLNKECVCQRKYDGTNLGIFLLPDGNIECKTRMTPRGTDVESWGHKGKTWMEFLQMCDNGKTLEKIHKLLQEHNYVVFGELYGYLNEGDFIKYTVPIDYKVFDILDRDKQSFLPPDEVIKVCTDYSLPMVETEWRGVLTPKEVQRLEFELNKELRTDGSEGLVAKTYDISFQDVRFAKLKCEAVKEKCWEVTAPTIPRGIIKKAIKKTLENFPTLKRIEDIEPYVLEELREEVEELLIKKSIEKIRDEIRFALTPPDESLYKVVYHEMMTMKANGIDLNDKRTVLPKLVQVLGTIDAGKLFQVYKAVLREIGE